MKNAKLLGMLVLASLPLSAVAKKDAVPEKGTPPPATRPSASKVDELAAKYKVPAAEVQGLRDKGLGWGEINNALAIARKAGQPVSAIMALRDSGMGWGLIAQKYGFKLGDAVGKGRERASDERHERGRGWDRGRDHGPVHGRGESGAHARGRGR